ncbi:MAG: hypothetical protein LBU12_08790 [Deltaproteobacteria bacterium]|jgi:hypothetical protein|nr:hypothetical protein [Deltaproteobacteria bacterium]
MLKLRDFEEINETAGLLAKSLSGPVPIEMPPDVAQALKAAKKQMEDLPSVIEDLNLAFSRYLTLNEALTRMISLAEESSRLAADQDEAHRRELEEEFDALAKVVAQEAGHRRFAGSGLNVADQGAATAAVRVLSYLKPVLENLDHEIRGQKALIVEALAETMNFLGVVSVCYPRAEGVERIRETLSRVRLPLNNEEPLIYGRLLH